MITWATEIKIRAERRVGEFLRETEKTAQRHTSRGVSSRGDTPLPKLKDIGITHDQSSTSQQQLASIPEQEFERRIRDGGMTDRRQVMRRSSVRTPGGGCWWLGGALLAACVGAVALVALSPVFA